MKRRRATRSWFLPTAWAGGVTTLGGNGPHRPQGAPRMAAVGVLGSVDELADGTGGSVDTVTGAAIGPYRKFRLARGAARALLIRERKRRSGALPLANPALARRN